MTTYKLISSISDGQPGFRTTQGVVAAVNRWARANNAQGDSAAIAAELANRMPPEMVAQLGLSVVEA